MLFLFFFLSFVFLLLESHLFSEVWCNTLGRMFGQRQPNCLKCLLIKDSGWRHPLQLPWRKGEGLKTSVAFSGVPGEVWNPLSNVGLTPIHCQTGHENSWETWHYCRLSRVKRVYCMTILQEEIWCFVNFELSVNCVRVTEPSPAPPPSPPPPHPKLPEPRVNTKPRPQSSFTISDCQFYMPFEPVK